MPGKRRLKWEKLPDVHAQFYKRATQAIESFSAQQIVALKLADADAFSDSLLDCGQTIILEFMRGIERSARGQFSQKLEQYGVTDEQLKTLHNHEAFFSILLHVQDASLLFLLMFLHMHLSLDVKRSMGLIAHWHWPNFNKIADRLRPITVNNTNSDTAKLIKQTLALSRKYSMPTTFLKSS